MGTLRRLLIALSTVASVWGTYAWAQTKLSLQSQAKDADLSNAASTKPMKTGNVLPSTCSTGEVFFHLETAPGSKFFACVATNTWQVQSLPAPGLSSKILGSDGTLLVWRGLGGDVSGSPETLTVTKLQGRELSNAAPSGGQHLVWNGATSLWEPQSPGTAAVTIESSGTVVGSGAVVNFIPGFGIQQSLSFTGTEIQAQLSVDGGVVQTRSGEQAGTARFCASSGSVTSDYTCMLNPAPLSYSTPMELLWKPDIEPAGAVTLNVNSLGAKAITLADGVTAPGPGEIQAGELYSIWYDGTVFRLKGAQRLPASVQPTCSAAMRARLWFVPGGTGVADNVTVCVKQADGIYAWVSL